MAKRRTPRFSTREADDFCQRYLLPAFEQVLKESGEDYLREMKQTISEVESRGLASLTPQRPSSLRRS